MRHSNPCVGPVHWLCAAKLAGDISILAEVIAALRACLVHTINAFLFDNVKVPVLVALITGV